MMDDSCLCCNKSPQILFRINSKKMLENKYIIDLIEGISEIKNYGNNWYSKCVESNEAICRQCLTKLENVYTFSNMIKANVVKRFKNGKRLMSPEAQLKPETDKTVTKRRKLVFSPEKSTHLILNDHGYSSRIVGDIKAPTIKTKEPRSREELIQHKINAAHSSNRLGALHEQLKKVQKESVLSKKRCLEKLQDTDTNIVMDMLEEMSEKVPFLFEVLVAAMGKTSQSSFAPLSAIYGIILFQRNHMMSAWQRCMSAVCLKGQLEDSALTILSNFGLTLSTSSKLRLEDEACASSKKFIFEMLRSNPLAKITGDNLDVFIRRDIVSTERKNKDIHLFASNILFPRKAKPCMENKRPEKHEVTVYNLKLNDGQRSQLLNLYKDVIGHIFANNIPGCEWMAHVKRSRHEYFELMSKKSVTAQLPIINANESKHEDCLKIMDGYKRLLTELYNEAHGTDEKLTEYRVVVGGDQVTRSRLQEAKALRSLSPNSKMRFDDLDTIVIELWHMKQDLLEKLFKALYDNKHSRTQGTWPFLKQNYRELIYLEK